MTLEEAIAGLKDGSIKPPTHCELCGRRGDEVGVFVPHEHFSKRLAAPDGKTRVVLYAACSRCLKKLGQQEYMRRVELVMEADTK